MDHLTQYAVVRVVSLVESLNNYDGWQINQRPPLVGDVGTLVEILTVPGLPDKYVVECLNEDGGTIWLSDFAAEELELADEQKGN